MWCWCEDGVEEMRSLGARILLDFYMSEMKRQNRQKEWEKIEFQSRTQEAVNAFVVTRKKAVWYLLRAMTEEEMDDESMRRGSGLGFTRAWCRVMFNSNAGMAADFVPRSAEEERLMTVCLEKPLKPVPLTLVDLTLA